MGACSCTAGAGGASASVSVSVASGFGAARRGTRGAGGASVFSGAGASCAACTLGMASGLTHCGLGSVTAVCGTEAPPAPRVPRRAAPKPEATETETEAEAPPAPAVQEQAPIQPILSADEQKRIQGAIEARRREIDDKLGRVKGHSSSHDK